ncbi:hypothetical protein IBT20_001722 [Salmonella enterica subsp. enterica serovar Rottnest]|nr:hypothetical protein [Salmonella enterica subsp. enterica serovar Rottnest]
MKPESFAYKRITVCDSVATGKNKRRPGADDAVDLQYWRQLLSCVFYAGGMKFTLE